MADSNISIHEDNRLLQAKYDITAWFYDILDYPWERQYRKWRPRLLGDVNGHVLEAGVGSGRNLSYYGEQVKLLGIDICKEMIRRALKRASKARCLIDIRQEDATVMTTVPSGQFDWLIATFLCCVMPDHLQPLAVNQFVRVLKPGGKFRLLEMVYSNDKKLRRRQERIERFVEKVYGARFDRGTLEHISRSDALRVTNTYFIKKDVYLIIEGEKVA